MSIRKQTCRTAVSAVAICAAAVSALAADAGDASGFKAAIADPLAWLYADSRVEAVERMDEIDVPANGVIDANILVNGLKPGERLEFDASEKGGEWYRMRAVPTTRSATASSFSPPTRRRCSSSTAS